MGFYQELSRHYDEIFPARESEAAFVRQLLAGKKRLLDIGCGTGNKTAMLKTDPTENVTGIDADPAMVETARRNHGNAGISFLSLDMRDMISVFSPGSFDSAVCLGNTLAHLTNPDELLELFRQVRTILEPDGVFVAQMINYNRIRTNQVDSLPVIETPNLVFTRRYEWRGGDMHFICTLRLKDGEEHHFDTILRPVLKAVLDGNLEEAGFGMIEYYGSFAGEPYDTDSYHTIFRAHA